MGGGGGDAPQLFYSRRIGLDGGRVVPILGGGRITGKVGAFTLGAMSIQTDDQQSASLESTNFSVVRIKRDILRRSSIGAMYTNRSRVAGTNVSNQAFGVDAGFAFFTNLQADAYYARTHTTGRTGDDESYRASVDFNGDRYGARAEHLKVGEAFTPEIGFARRFDFVKSSGALRFSPRPASIPWIRKLTWEATLNYFEDGAGSMESRERGGRFNVELASSDMFTLQYTDSFERLLQPFRVGTDAAGENVLIPAGTYGFGSVRTSYNFGQQRRVSGNLSLQRGDFYDGKITSLGLSMGRVVVTNHLSLEPGFTLNRINLPVGNVKQNLLRSRLDYAFTSRMFASALVQYSTSDEVFSSNMRFRWEYRPGSELFVVWTDERDTSAGGGGLRNRALALKVTRLLRF